MAIASPMRWQKHQMRRCCALSKAAADHFDEGFWTSSKLAPGSSISTAGSSNPFRLL
jgi:hypothetical protein